jgi:MYXO-CTERM domain-containing protein
MKITYKVFGTLALAAVGSSMASAQDAYSYAYAYATASFYSYAGSGVYITNSGGEYGYGYYQYGNATGVDYLNYNIGNPAMGEVYGGSEAWAQPGGSFSNSGLIETAWTTITNTSNYYQELFVDVVTEGYGVGYTDSFNGFGVGSAYGWVFDTAGALDQLSETESAASGIGAPALALASAGTYGYSYNFDYFNGWTGSSYYLGGSYPNGIFTSAYDSQSYVLWFAPGESDTFNATASEGHAAYATTPAPAAIAPFALGLIAALRRRKKG